MRRKHFNFWAVTLISFSLVLLVGFGAMFQHFRYKMGPLAAPTLVYIAPGSGVISASWALKKANALSTPWHLQMLSSVLGVTGSIRAGEFEIPPKATLNDILDILMLAEPYERRLVVPEGSSNVQIFEILSTATGLEMDGAILPDEGHLLPDTYFYHYGTDAGHIIWQMSVASGLLVDSLWATRGSGFPLKSTDDVLILASIIEEETSLPDERPLIAAVFLNRLKQRIRLQTDPTVIYGLTNGLPLGRRLTSQDLRKDTPYNSYLHYGLPPTAISNPGMAAIEAVFAPADVDYLYFVADGTGGHVFAKTLAEHNKNVRKWRKIRDTVK